MPQMIVSNMGHTLNSPVHRSRNLLCGDLSGRARSANHNLFGCPPRAQPLGERISTTLSSTAPMRVPDSSLQMLYLGSTSSGYYNDPGTIHAQGPRFSYYNPVADSRYDPSIPTYEAPGISLDFTATNQPPIPPAAPEQSILPEQAFCFHLCRWLGGPQCDGLAPGKNREMGEHLRAFHHFVGHERDPVQCKWEGCGQSMQRMNVPRHIVSRHLLAAASCRFCKRRFSRPDVVARHERTCSGISPASNIPGSGH